MSRQKRPISEIVTTATRAAGCQKVQDHHSVHNRESLCAVARGLKEIARGSGRVATNCKVRVRISYVMEVQLAVMYGRFKEREAGGCDQRQPQHHRVPGLCERGAVPW